MTGSPLSYYANDVINPETLGAAGDGYTDSTAAIQAALNAGSVYLPAGTYVISRPLVMNSNTTLTGAGYSTRLLMASGANARHIVDASNTTNCTVRDLLLDGNGSRQSSGTTSLLGGDSSTNLTVRNVWAVNSWTQGIYFGSATGALINGCTATANGIYGSAEGFGFGLNGNATSCRITGCFSSGNQEGGYSLYGSTAANAAEHCSITACAAHGEVNGFNLYNAQECAVSGCTAVACTTAGIQVEYGAQGVTISGCTADGTLAAGNGTYGINLIPSGTGCAVVGCTATGAGTGINVDAASDVTVSGNNCYGNVNTGIYLGHNTGVTNFTVTGNICQGQGQQGIITGNTPNTYGVISGNTCAGNTGGGSSSGIALQGTTTYVTVSDNMCTGNGYGIREIQGAVNYIVYTGNVCHGNTTAQLTTSGAGDVLGANITA